MRNLDTYNILKSKYGKYASWAIWREEDYADASIIENSISELNPNIVFVGLNASRDVTDGVWRAFHCKHQGGSDWKLMAIDPSTPEMRATQISSLRQPGRRACTQLARDLACRLTFRMSTARGDTCDCEFILHASAPCGC